MESLLGSIAILAILAIALLYLAKKLPEPGGLIVRVCVYAGLAIWLIYNVRRIIAVLAHCC
jgi:hypothetical protein